MDSQLLLDLLLKTEPHISTHNRQLVLVLLVLIILLPLTGLSTVQTIENRFVPQQRIYIKDHGFFTGQKLTYNIGVGGTSLVWAKVSAGATSGLGTQTLLNYGDVYAINFEPDYIGLSTTGIPTTGDAIWFFDVASNSGFAHSFTTNTLK